MYLSYIMVMFRPFMLVLLEQFVALSLINNLSQLWLYIVLHFTVLYCVVIVHCSLLHALVAVFLS